MLRYLFFSKQKKISIRRQSQVAPPAKSYPYDGITRIRFIGCISAQNDFLFVKAPHPVAFFCFRLLYITQNAYLSVTLFYNILLNIA